ncbi:hypothetical protein VTJ04DRAFT_6613 [Mycothermus thermophilus]|uniref:uncharacterized protein n=1 Tax=Humicola insolens TaxID=85995 RepID=UPI003744467A
MADARVSRVHTAYSTLKDQRRGQNPPTDKFLRDPRRAYLRFVQILVRPSSVSKREAFRKVLHWSRPRSLASRIFSNLFTVEDSYPWSQVMEELPGPARNDTQQFKAISEALLTRNAQSNRHHVMRFSV